MNKHSFYKLSSLTLALSLITSFGFASVASAIATPAPVSTNPSNAVTAIIAQGDQKVAARLTSLAALGTKVSGLKKVTPADKTSLLNEITNTTAGLKALQTKLDADTTVKTATADYNQIFTGYRVYLLVVPKVAVVSNADSQQARETVLQTYHDLLQQHVTAALTAKEQPRLADMQSKITAAKALSAAAESNALKLTPTDYNTDHTLFTDYYNNLKTAHSDDVTAYNDGHAVLNDLLGNDN